MRRIVTPVASETTPIPPGDLPRSASGPRNEGWFYAVALVVLSVLLVGTMWVVPYLPTNDGPEWVFATHVENHYSDPGTPYAAAYVPTLQFASRGLSVVYGPFEAWLGWERGLQAALSLVVLGTAWGFFALARALHPDRRAIGLLGFPLALSWSVYMGFWSFAIATGLGFFILALAVRLRDPTWKGRVVLAVLLLVQAVAHVFGAVLVGGALVALGMARAPRGRRVRELGCLALTGAPAAGVLLACVLVSGDLVHAAVASGTKWLPWRNAVAVIPGTIAPGPHARALAITFAVVAAAVVAAIRACRRETDAADRGLGTLAVVLLLTGVFAPFQVPGWQAFSERFIPLGVALAFAVVPLEHLPLGVRRFAPAALFTGAALSLGLTYAFHRRLTKLCPDAIAGLSAPIQIHGKLLSVILGETELPLYNRTEAEVPLMDPLIHMGNLYAAAHGGIPLRSFTGNRAVHPFIKRPRSPDAPPEPDFIHYAEAINSYEFHHEAAFRRAVDDQLAGFGLFYDEVAVFGARPEDLVVWRDRGYVADWQARSAFVAHFVSCSIDFTVPQADGEAPPSFDVRAGEIGLLADVRVPFVVRDDGLAHFDLTPAPCGRVTVRARWTAASGAVSFCSNANADGDLFARINRTARKVACHGH
jgi:hypothetical protein